MIDKINFLFNVNNIELVNDIVIRYIKIDCDIFEIIVFLIFNLLNFYRNRNSLNDRDEHQIE